MEFTNRAGQSIAYRVVGTGPRTVIGIHGWMMNGRAWDHVRAHLNVDGWRLVLLDSRGGGASGKPETGFGLQELVDDVSAVAEATGSESYVLMGHSMGGLVALTLAAQKPTKCIGLALASPVPLSGMEGVPPPPNAEAVYGAMRGCGKKFEQIGQVLDGTIVGISPANKTYITDLAMESSVACVEQTFDTFGGGGDPTLYPEITAPALVISADDPVLTADFLKARVTDKLANARQVKIDGSGHYIINEKPAEAARHIQEFLGTL